MIQSMDGGRLPKNTNYILIEPHQDDLALFASFICLRLKPFIISVTDGTQHFEKFGIPIETRREESRQAAHILGCDIRFLGIPDTEDIQKIDLPKGTIISPAFQGGNHHHDQLSRYGDIHYSSYAKGDLTPGMEDGVAIRPTQSEESTKEKALACYKSQHDINKEHFEAVRGHPEYISFKKGLLTASIRKALLLDPEIPG